MQKTKAIGKTSGQKLAETLPFLIGEAGGTAVIFRMGQIDFLMGDIKITGRNDRFFLIQNGQIIGVLLVPDCCPSN